MAKKGGAITVKMQSTESSYFYVARRNPRAEKLARRAYDAVLRKHVLFKETKLK
jgi:large subunit ribosomal protein L33